MTFNLRTLLNIQLLTYETMSENIDMTDATYCKKPQEWENPRETLIELSTKVIQGYG